MKVKELTMAKSVKVTVNYQSVSVTYGMTVEVDNGDDINEVRVNLSREIDRILRAEIEKTMEVIS